MILRMFFDEKLGTIRDVKVRLELKDVQPVFFKARPVPFSMKKYVDAELDKLINQ